MMQRIFAASLCALATGFRVPAQSSKPGSAIAKAEQAYRDLMSRRLVKGQVHSQNDDDELPPLDDYPQCNLSKSICSVKDMTEATIVWADNSDMALCYNGDPFAFVVVPGASDKLAYSFPGGGVCFDIPGWFPGEADFCFPGIQMGLAASGVGYGAFDGSSNTGLSDHSIIAPAYCSGGGHISNTTFRSGGETRYQYGYHNNEITRQWALTNFGDTLTSFVIMGTSAGALGVGIWADTLLSSFRYEKATVLMDSYLSIFPGITQSKLLKHLGGCSTPPLARFRRECENNEGTMEQILDYTIGKYPNVAFAHIQSKYDAIQLLFYGLVGFHFGGAWSIPGDEFYFTSNALLSVYNKHPNYVLYLANGQHHTFPYYPVEWYSSTILGPNTTDDLPAGTPMMFEWFNALINHEAVSSQCDGVRAPNGASGKYCSEELFPKTLSV